MKRLLKLAASGAVALLPTSVSGQTTGDVPARRPAAVVDLRTDEGTRLVQGQWRYRDARIVEVNHRLPGPDRAVSQPPHRPHAHLRPHHGAGRPPAPG